MADQSQPPEGLRQIVAQVLRDAGMAFVEFDDSCGDWIVEEKTWQYEEAAGAVLAALFAACEVREENRIVIDDERASGLPVNGLWVTPPVMADTHTSLLGRYPSARMERRFVIETPPEPIPVVSDSSEGEQR